MNWLTDYIGAEWLVTISLCIGMVVGFMIGVEATVRAAAKHVNEKLKRD